jgi:peptidoglycan/LPS O-acetylase OafA/YrhL
LRVPLGRLLRRLAACLSLGIMLPSVNGVELDRFNAQVFWTLRYEWFFYIVFPFLAWFAAPRRFPWLGLLVLAAAWPPVQEVVPFKLEMLAHFLLGMAAAHVVAADRLARCFRTARWPLLAIALLTGITLAYPTLWNQFALQFLVFTAIAYDSRLFAFLRWPAAKCLGTISYSVYLMHGIALFVVFYAVNRVVSVETLTDYGFWSVTCCCGLLVVLGSAITYRFVEHPFLSIKPAVAVAKIQALNE